MLALRNMLGRRAKLTARRRWALIAIGLSGCCLCAACDSDDATPPPARLDAGPSSAPRDAATTSTPPVEDPADVFVAFAANFKGFHDWPHYDVTIENDAGPDHPEEHLIEYINRLPPHGATAFPLRTIVIKEPVMPTMPGFFAMVKRGGGFNSDGAAGWEWFELQNIEEGGVLIVWRGVGPPSNDEYGGDPNTGCNDCHTPKNNDSVLAPALALSNF